MEFQVTGFKEIDKALRELEKKEINKICKKGVREGSKIIAADVRQNMPVDTGTAKKNVVVRNVPRKALRKGQVGSFVGNTREKFEQKTGKDFYLQFIEYGNGSEGQEPAAPFRRAYDAKGEEAISKAIKTIVDEVNKFTGKGAK